MAKKTTDDPFAPREVDEEQENQPEKTEQEKAPPAGDVIEDRKEFIDRAMEREKEGLPVDESPSVDVPKNCVAVVANKNFVVDRKIFDEGATIAAVRKGVDLSKIQSKDVSDCACSFDGLVRAIGADHVCLK